MGNRRLRHSLGVKSLAAGGKLKGDREFMEKMRRVIYIPNVQRHAQVTFNEIQWRAVAWFLRKFC
jgi:hypothetical protein